jgi:hypothetical protein
MSNSRDHQKILLTANWAKIYDFDAYLDALDTWIIHNRDLDQVLILGDLFPPCNEDRIDPFLRWVGRHPKVKVTVIPGDLDWGDQADSGWHCLLEMEDALRRSDLDNLKWPLDDGCPGPEARKLGNRNLEAVFLNSNYFAHPALKPQASDAICDFIDPERFFEELEDLLVEEEDRLSFIAAHDSPFGKSYRGGRANPSLHLIPVAGSLVAAHRMTIGNRFSMIRPALDPLMTELRDFVLHTKPIIYLYGQDLAHELFEMEGQIFIGVGNPVHGAAAASRAKDPVRSGKPGVVLLECEADLELKYSFLPFKKGQIQDPEQEFILYPGLEDGAGGVFGLLNPLAEPDERAFISAEKDTTRFKTAAAGPQYVAGARKQFFFGKHHRDAWTTSIELPVLDLDTTKGGLEILKRGGGRQTKSLKLRAVDGQDFVFRSVDKDPAKALGYDWRATLVAQVARDQTTTQHPYGALVASRLLDEIGILHARPRLYFLPDDERLGGFRSEFGGIMGMLEEKPSNKGANPTYFESADLILKSNEMFKGLYAGEGRVNLEEYLRARIFDIWVGDWGKHEDNWKWAAFYNPDPDPEDITQWTYRPIPRDRDHVFSTWDGLFPWLADREWAKTSGEHFDYEIKGLRSLTWQVRHMDRFLCAENELEDWLLAAQQIQAEISEADISAAMGQLPEGVYEQGGAEIEAKLQQRLKDLDRYAEEYFQMLATEVDLVGTNEYDLFQLNWQGGELVVSILDDQRRLRKQRKIRLHETEELRVFGLAGNDCFEFSGQDADLRIRIIPGPGWDTVRAVSNYLSTKRPRIYSQQEESFEIGRRMLGVSTESMRWDRTAFRYNNYFPLIWMSYGAFSGFQISGGVDFETQKYGVPEYHTRHEIRAAVSTQTQYWLNYRFTGHHWIGRGNFLLDLGLQNPSDRSWYYGLGNGSTQMDTAQSFYRVFLDQQWFSLGVEREFWRFASARALFGVVRTEGRGREGSFADAAGLLADENFSQYYTKWEIDLDLRDSDVFPRRGSRFYLSGEIGLQGENETFRNRSYKIATGSMSWYLTPRKEPFTVAFRAGGAVSEGSLAWFQLPQLGMSTGLRGFRAARFRDSGVAYGNLGLRIPITNIASSWLPVSIGLLGFCDAGRTFNIRGAFAGFPDEDRVDANLWHLGYGGGIYLVPLSESFTVRFELQFSDEELPLFAFGFGTPL